MANRLRNLLILGGSIIALGTIGAVTIPKIMNNLNDDNSVSCASVASGMRGSTYCFEDVSSHEAAILDSVIQTTALSSNESVTTVYNFSNRHYKIGFTTSLSYGRRDSIVRKMLNSSGLREKNRMFEGPYSGEDF
ncbi:hypothetical protein HY212_04510 [Candidatus Pacearchaeota archaeon]|nr:hypothetical protein [Candidatus Pacearchaeota archaeon]